jgi:hypothetical protein
MRELPRAMRLVGTTGLLGVFGLIALVTPSSAEAKTPQVRPFVTCATRTSTALVVTYGYENSTGSSVDIPFGQRNRLSPAGSTNPPTTFTPGRVPVAFSATFGAKSKPKWIVQSGSTSLIATIVPSTPTCPPISVLPPAARSHGLTLTLDGKTTVFRFPVTTKPQKLDGNSHVLVAMFKPDVQGWGILVGGGGLSVQFGWEASALVVGTFPLGGCPSKDPCGATPKSYAAVATDGKPETTLLALELPSVGLKPATLTISSIQDATFPNDDPNLAPVPYRYVTGTIDGKIASVSYTDSGPVVVRGPSEAKITFDVWLEGPSK